MEIIQLEEDDTRHVAIILSYREASILHEFIGAVGDDTVAHAYHLPKNQFVPRDPKIAETRDVTDDLWHKLDDTLFPYGSEEE